MPKTKPIGGHYDEKLELQMEVELDTEERITVLRNRVAELEGRKRNIHDTIHRLMRSHGYPARHKLLLALADHRMKDVATAVQSSFKKYGNQDRLLILEEVMVVARDNATD